MMLIFVKPCAEGQINSGSVSTELGGNKFTFVNSSCKDDFRHRTD